ncbi:hypothetical protein EDD21DRAFT_414731 [Dissophora ornata]|nr:hypothetical protein BGZ58_007243 [Dissophora ornata]KAI8601625.1 hypothetical protein EDD21DRAFT_414731 [Dissophora ornata]
MAGTKTRFSARHQASTVSQPSTTSSATITPPMNTRTNARGRGKETSSRSSIAQASATTSTASTNTVAKGAKRTATEKTDAGQSSSSGKRRKVNQQQNKHNQNRAPSSLPTPPQPTPEAQDLQEEEEKAAAERAEKTKEHCDHVEVFSESQFLGYRATNPLGLHEIRTNVARFLSRRDLRSCLLVCESWWDSFAPFLWAELRPVYRNVLGGSSDYPPYKLMKKNGHLIKTFEYNGHGTVLLSMIASDGRFDTLYKDEDQDWRKTEEEEAEEESWMYVDDDVDADTSLDANETLSDFEDKMETRKTERRERLAQMKTIIAANKRQNEVSRFLNDTTDYRQRVCDQIERLIFTEKRFSRDRGCHYRNWIKLMQINRGNLRSLEFNFAIRAFEAYRDIFNQVLSLKKLTELTLVENDLDALKVRPFLETICVRLVKLELRNVRIEYGSFPGQVGQNNIESPIPLMEKMKSLSFFNVIARNTSFPLQFLRQCPNLVELAVRSQQALHIKEFPGVLSEKLPRVTYLTYRYPGMSDMDVASIIKSLPVIEKLDFSGTMFGLMATNHLSTRHPFVISYLDIKHCSQVTGAMIQWILGECRNLRVFIADHIQAKDMINNMVYPSWACVGLKELTLDFRGDFKDYVTNRMVYKQLAQLTCLEHLDISRATQTGEYSNCLTLGLNDGLRDLRTLVHMNRLIYRSIKHNEVGLAELKWMAKAWPRLGQIGGKLKERKLSNYNPNVHPKEEDRRDLLDVLDSEPSTVTPSNGRNSTDPASEAAASTATTSSSPSSSSSSSLPPFASPVPRNPSLDTSTFHNVATEHASGSATASSTSRPFSRSPRLKPEVPPNLMAIELRRLKLHHRIKVIRHFEDRVTADQRKRFRHKYALGESSDEEADNIRAGQSDPRYRHGGEWI